MFESFATARGVQKTACPIAVVEQDVEIPKPLPHPSVHIIVNRVPVIQKMTAAYFDVPMNFFMCKLRDKKFSWPRMVGMYLCREITDLSYPQIGRLFDRDHTTILHGYRRTKSLMSSDPEFAVRVILLSRKVQEALEGRIKPTEKQE